MSWQIRAQTLEDVPEVSRLIYQAFLGQPYADGDEHQLIEALVGANALHLALVAQLHDEIVGQVAFSPTDVERVYTLGPLAVSPVFQQLGIGRDLVTQGLQRLSQTGARAVILTGDPKYYLPLGFRLAPECCPKETYSRYFMVHEFNHSPLNQVVNFHPLFEGNHD